MASGLLGWCQSSPVVGFVLLLLLVVDGGRIGVRGELSDRDREVGRASCFETVSSWSQRQLHQLSSLPRESEMERVKLRDLLFFLHIPRTGGRTFDQCFLTHLFESSDRCQWSYDKVRFNRSQPECHLISTHDDFSLIDDLPLDTTSVVTYMRDPVDRVLSSYEFSVEVAARSPRVLRDPTKKFPKDNSMDMGTLDIWPWKYLVRTMQKDLAERRNARGAVEGGATGLSADDSYDAPAIAMPFEEFINLPVAHELVHNGATFQVAGLTNISYSVRAGAIRDCVIRFPPLGELVVDVAKKRLDRMLYVGLTERHNESALFFARALDIQISMERVLKKLLSAQLGKSKKRNLNPKPPNMKASRLQANFTSRDKFTKEASRLQASFRSVDELTEEEVIEGLLAAYSNCVAGVRIGQKERKLASLEMVKPIEFSRERRKLIPDDVMEKVAAFNLLDSELYTHAQDIFQKQQGFLQHRDFLKKETKISRGNVDDLVEGLKDRYGFPFSRGHLQAFWALIALWVLIILIVLVTVLLVRTKRRAEREKMF